MEDNEKREPEHLFRVQYGCSHGEYIAADFMTVTMDGVTQLHIRTGEHGLEVAAVILPSAGLSVVRVDTLINEEGMTRS